MALASSKLALHLDRVTPPGPSMVEWLRHDGARPRIRVTWRAMPLPDVVTRKLADDMYRRRDRAAVQRALAELGTPVPADFREFGQRAQ